MSCTHAYDVEALLDKVSYTRKGPLIRKDGSEWPWPSTLYAWSKAFKHNNGSIKEYLKSLQNLEVLLVKIQETTSM